MANHRVRAIAQFKSLKIKQQRVTLQFWSTFSPSSLPILAATFDITSQYTIGEVKGRVGGGGEANRGYVTQVNNHP